MKLQPIDFAKKRQQLVERLSTDLAIDERIEIAFSRVPREEFLPSGAKDSSYLDAAQPLGYGATISQPSMLAIMLLELRLEPGLTVLEAGSGCGYFLALLEACGANATGVEIIPSLAEKSKETLLRLGYRARVMVGDAAQVKYAKKFDRVVFSAAVKEIPPWALEILAPEGFVLAPVGQSDCQELVRATPEQQEATGRLCRFIPFV